LQRTFVNGVGALPDFALSRSLRTEGQESA
jgi:hypothetical protein